MPAAVIPPILASRVEPQAENSCWLPRNVGSLAELHDRSAVPRRALSHAWKNVLFNQFHDILAGTSLEAAYEDAREQYGEAMSIADRALNRAIQSLAWKINIEPEAGMIPIVVFNPHAWRRPVEHRDRSPASLKRRVLVDDTRTGESLTSSSNRRPLRRPEAAELHRRPACLWATASTACSRRAQAGCQRSPAGPGS